MALTPLQVAQCALANQMGVASGTLVPRREKYFGWGFNYPESGHPIFAGLYHEVSVLWDPKDTSLLMSTLLKEMRFSSWKGANMYRFFKNLSKDMRLFLELPPNKRKACAITPFYADNERKALVPGFVVVIDYPRMSQDELRTVIGVLFEKSLRTLAICRTVLGGLTEGTVFDRDQQLQHLIREWQRLRLADEIASIRVTETEEVEDSFDLEDDDARVVSKAYAN